MSGVPPDGSFGYGGATGAVARLEMSREQARTEAARLLLDSVLFNAGGAQTGTAIRYDTFLFDEAGAVRPEWRDAYSTAQSLHTPDAGGIYQEADVKPVAEMMLQDPAFVTAVIRQADLDSSQSWGGGLGARGGATKSS